MAKVHELDPGVQEWLGNQFTSLDEPVYFATPSADPTVVATALARLSRSPDDLRCIMGKEFAEDDTKAPETAERILLKYGDDSVAQLLTLQAVVERPSNLLTKILEWGRLASYLEQSTRFMKFDTKDARGRYPFFTPDNLSPESVIQYEICMEQIFDAYSRAVNAMEAYLGKIMKKDPELGPKEWEATLRAQACDSARVLLPVAVQTTVGIVGSAQAFENMITRMRSLSLPEARNIGNSLLRHARIVAPQYFKRVDMPDRGEMTSSYLSDTRARIQERAAKLGLVTADGMKGEQVNLVDYTPPDELAIIPYVLFEASNISLSGIERAISELTDDEKRVILREYIGERQHNRRHKPGRALEHPHYSWELMTDYGIFRDLQRHRMVDDLRWQALSCNHGHLDIPELAQQAGIADQFTLAYEISERLTNQLRQEYGAETAQYATLLGHLMRWTMTENAREAYHLHELRTSSQGHPGYRRVVNEIHTKLAEVHPTIAEGMVHVDTTENPGLARLQEALRTARNARATGQQ